MVRPQTANQQAARSMLRQGAGLGDCSGVGYRGCYPALWPFLVGVEGWWPGFGQVLCCSSLLLGVAVNILHPVSCRWLMPGAYQLGAGNKWTRGGHQIAGKTVLGWARRARGKGHTRP